ncbi:MAG: hypothetical protein P1P87_17240, partial [Trueperaceae bacterium]|nr:hypothetical protein [Trueperaceae bacterium]
MRTLLAALVLGRDPDEAAWSPVPGMELLLTDLGARSLVGYGVADDASLRVELAVDRARLQVLWALPGGDVRSLVGELADGRVWFWDAGRWQDLASVLAADGYELVLDLADGRSLTVAPASPEDYERLGMMADALALNLEVRVDRSVSPAVIRITSDR